MCQLLGLNANVPTDICFSLTGFRARGGQTDIHKDGWGIAFFEGRGVRQFLDHESSATSQIAELVQNYPIKSTNIVAHIRRATSGTNKLENTHPFMREMWSQYWIFAHNGHLENFVPFDKSITKNGERPTRYNPVGNTDSELSFCWILEDLHRDLSPQSENFETELFAKLRELCIAATAHGEFNFLLSQGTWMFAHCSTQLCYIIRKAPFSIAKLVDRDLSLDFSGVTGNDDKVAVIATAPLTNNETWINVPPGTMLMFKDGELAQEAKTLPGKKNPKFKTS